jgi:hypothetical protein
MSGFEDLSPPASSLKKTFSDMGRHQYAGIPSQTKSLAGFSVVSL